MHFLFLCRVFAVLRFCVVFVSVLWRWHRTRVARTHPAVKVFITREKVCRYQTIEATSIIEKRRNKERERERDVRQRQTGEVGAASSDNFRGFRAKLAKWWIDLQSSGWVGRSVTCEIFERQVKRDLALGRACTLGTHVAPTIYDLPVFRSLSLSLSFPRIFSFLNPL